MHLQTLALIQPTTSLIEFARSPRTNRPGFYFADNPLFWQMAGEDWRSGANMFQMPRMGMDMKGKSKAKGKGKGKPK